MIQASEAFHASVRNGAPQRALLRFDTATFGNADISITGGGIRLTEIINGETNLHYGLCSSAHLEVSLLNSNGLLDSFEFGKFKASIGVLVEVENTPYVSDSFAITPDGNVFTAGADGQLYVNGTLANLQTSGHVRLIVLQDNTLYAFGDGRTWLAGHLASDGVTLQAVDVEISELMWDKIENLMKQKVGYRLSDGELVEYRNGKAIRYEMAPLGTFIATRPSVLRKVVVELEAEDQMQLFDADASDVEFSYPLTMQSAYETLCESVGVEYIDQSIPNGHLTVREKPDVFDGATKRDILGWIAEASATFARFNREGLLELTRFSDTGVEYDEHHYVTASPSAYEVKPFEKLHIRNADADVEQVVGDGENAYLIQDNPFLKPQTLTALTRDGANQSASDVILDALAEVGTFAPMAADTFADWSMQAGDIVTIKSGDKLYKTPVYSLGMTWKGSPRVTMESTGDEKAQPIPLFERRRYSSGRSVARAKKENEEFKTWAKAQINEADANIKLLTGSVTTATGEYINVSTELDGIKGTIRLQSDTLNEHGELISGVSFALDGKASKAELEANYVTIKALETTVSGLVKTEDLETETLKVLESARIPDLKALAFSCSGRAKVHEIWATGGVITNATIPNLYIPTDGEIRIPDGAELNLFGYTPRWNQMKVMVGLSIKPTAESKQVMLSDGTSTKITYITGIDPVPSMDTITYLYRGS